MKQMGVSATAPAEPQTAQADVNRKAQEIRTNLEDASIGYLALVYAAAVRKTVIAGRDLGALFQGSEDYAERQAQWMLSRLTALGVGRIADRKEPHRLPWLRPSHRFIRAARREHGRRALRTYFLPSTIASR